MKDPTDFFLTGYIALPPFLGWMTHSINVWAVASLVTFLLFFLVATYPKDEPEDADTIDKE